MKIGNFYCVEKIMENGIFLDDDMNLMTKIHKRHLLEKSKKRWV
jgi:hypothetical protein